MRPLVPLIAALALSVSACQPPPGDPRRPIFADVPATIDPTARFLFHLHGTVVEEQGPAGRSRHGQYLYYPTVEALADRGFVVISEVRPPTQVVPYAIKVAGQVARLRAAGVPADHITVNGVSKGGVIALLTTITIADPDVRFVIMACCLRGGNLASAFAALGQRPPRGRVLSLYDHDDPEIGTCAHFFPAAPGLGFEEIVLTTGRGHALFFSPETVWVDRVVEWARAP